MIDINEYSKRFYKGMKKPSLNAMRFFMNKYNNFEKKMKFIHIAGTNGKGSCTEMISNVLVIQGYKVGKFISPHLIKFNERICINGKDISDEELLELLEELTPVIEEYNNTQNDKITFFEFQTILTLLYFYRNNVDFAVLETGLGGLYDCTNIITMPLVSIITSIGYDHMNILGKSLIEIAKQKAGIIKRNSNTIIFQNSPDIDNIFIEICKDNENEIHIVKESTIKNYSYDNNFQYFDYKDKKNIAINLRGKVQIKNAVLCIEAIDILKKSGYNISDENLKYGLKSVVHKGRMECLNEFPTIIYDGAHNEPAIKNFQNMIKMYYQGKKNIYIIAILKSKDYDKILKILAKDANGYFVLTSGSNTGEFATCDELYSKMIRHVSTNKICKKNLEKALEDSMNGDINCCVFVVGSFHIYDIVDKIIKKEKRK